MTSICDRLLLAEILILCVIFNPIWSFSIDILMTNATDLPCSTPVFCRSDFRNQSSVLNVTLILHPSDEFVAAKTVLSLHGDMAIIGSHSSCQLNADVSSHNVMSNNRQCSFNCSELLNEHHPIFLQGIFRNTQSNRQTIFINSQDDNRIMSTIITSISLILSHENWKKVIVFTSKDAELTALLSSFQPSLQMFLVLDEGRDLNRTVARLFVEFPEEDLNVIVMSSTKYVLKLLHQIQAALPSICVYNGCQRLGKSAHLSGHLVSSLFAGDLQTYAYLSEYDMVKLSRWLIVTTGKSIEKIVNTQTDIKTNDVVFVNFSTSPTDYPPIELVGLLSFLESRNKSTHFEDAQRFIEKIKDSCDARSTANVYKLHRTPHGMTFHNRGFLRQNKQMVLKEELYSGISYGLNNRMLRVAVMEWPPYVYKKTENGSISYSGISLDLLCELSRRLNFSYELTEPEDKEWGSIVDGKWTGMVGLMAEKKADLALAPIAVDFYREMVMDFTIPFFYVQSTVLLKKSDPNTNKWMTLVAPFRVEVHICVLLSLIFSTVLLFILEEASPLNSWTDRGVAVRWTRYGEIFWYHFGAMMANGGSYLPITQSGRSVLTCWWLFTVICAAIYSGNLIAFLSDLRERPPFSTLEEMVQQDIHQWGTLGGGVLINNLKNSNQSVYQKIWQRLKADMVNDPDVLSPDNDVHLRKVLAGQYAFISDEAILELWQLKHCNLYRLKEEFFLMLFAVGLPNNSNYTAIFSEQVLRITESGLIDVWMRRWKPKSYCKTTVSSKRVDLLALQSVFYGAGVGVLLALFVLMSEVIWYRVSTKQLTKTTHESQ